MDDQRKLLLEFVAAVDSVALHLRHSLPDADPNIVEKQTRDLEQIARDLRTVANVCGKLIAPGKTCAEERGHDGQCLGYGGRCIGGTRVIDRIV